MQKMPLFPHVEFSEKTRTEIDSIGEKLTDDEVDTLNTMSHCILPEAATPKFGVERDLALAKKRFYAENAKHIVDDILGQMWALVRNGDPVPKNIMEAIADKLEGAKEQIERI